MHAPGARAQALTDYLQSSDGRRLVQTVWFITALMLVGALATGLAFGLIIGLGAENAPVDPTSPPVHTRRIDQPDLGDLPMLGLVTLASGLAGAIGGVILLGQVRRRNQAILNGGEDPFLPQSMGRATLTACLVACALLEGATLLAFLLALVGEGKDRTLCLGVASALLVWWGLNLPTRARFASLLGLEPGALSS